MKKETRFGTFEELMEMTSPELRPIARDLRALIFSVYRDAVEVVGLGEGAATYGMGQKKMSEGYVYILPHKKWVNLGFYKGVSLPDPVGLLEGTGKKLRHVKIRSIADTRRPEVCELIEEAYKERKQALQKETN